MSKAEQNADQRIEAENALTNVPGDSVLEVAADSGVAEGEEYHPTGEARGGKYGQTKPDKGETPLT